MALLNERLTVKKPLEAGRAELQSNGIDTGTIPKMGYAGQGTRAVGVQDGPHHEFYLPTGCKEAASPVEGCESENSQDIPLLGAGHLK